MTQKPVSLSWVLLGLAIIIAAISLLVLARPLLISLLIAGLISYLLNPLVEVGERRWPGKRPILVPIIYVTALLILIALLLTLGVIIWEQIPTWGEELNTAFLEMRQWWERPITFLGFTLNPQVILDYLQRTSGNAISTIPLASGGFFGGIANNLIWTLVVLVSLYYFLRDGRLIRVNILRAIPYTYRQEVSDLWQKIDDVWRIFLRAQLLIFLILSLLIAASTSLIIWLFRSGRLPLSPVGLILLLILVYSAIQQVDNLWLRPQLMGNTLELHPGLVIVSLLSALVLTGLLGALLIIPILATLKVIGLHLYHRFTLPEEPHVPLHNTLPQDPLEDTTPIESPALPLHDEPHKTENDAGHNKPPSPEKEQLP